MSSLADLPSLGSKKKVVNEFDDEPKVKKGALSAAEKHLDDFYQE